MHKGKNHDEGFVMTFEVGDLAKPKEGWLEQDIGLVVKVEKYFYSPNIDRIHVDWIGSGVCSTEPSNFLEKA